LNGIADFVALQMTDHLPAQMARAKRDFGFRFLNFIFAEERQTKLSGFIHDFRRLAFGDGEQRDRIRLAAGAFAGGANALLN
jgi:hypothetical protein